MNLWEFGALGPGEVWGVPGDAEPSLRGSGRAEMELLGRSFRTRLRVWSMANPFQILGDPPSTASPFSHKVWGCHPRGPQCHRGLNKPPSAPKCAPSFLINLIFL